MKNTISHQLTQYLARTMFAGVVCILIVATFFSVSTHRKNYEENQESLTYFVENVLPAAAHFISVGDMVKLKRRMDSYTENERSRNLQIKILDPQGQVMYQSTGFTGECESRLLTLKKHIPICHHQSIYVGDKLMGNFSASRNIRSFSSFFIEFFLPAFAIVLFLFIALFFVVTKRFLKSSIVQPMNQLVQSLEQNTDVDADPMRNKAYEWGVLRKAIQDYRKRITEYIIRQQQINSDLEKEKILSEVTSQLAYDIRSPLEALDSMAAHFPELDDRKRTMIRKATERIHTIADNLLSRSAYQNQNATLQMISSLVRSLLFEKREQYKENRKVTIHEYIDPQMYGVFARIEVNEFKNVLSHVIDNAVEAVTNMGFVRVALTQKNDNIMIDVFDNGKGIPPEILYRVTSRGFSYQKEGGKGFGLYLADQKMREWGGRLEIESTVNSGTSVKLIFRKEAAPNWFVSEIPIHEDQQFVVLDDDEAIHEMWEDRILQAIKKNIRIHHFHDGKMFEDWFGKSGGHKDMMYFMDYELMGNQKSGLDIIENLHITSNSVLVTSHYDNESIQKRCEVTGVRMIPKELANIIPIVST